ncbi:hypothetical protein JRO89_XS12G0233800 [Xanthoceras sorbifolium]|uniref:CSC1-like protein HYP1 n=1 Tax=Xanthoceras sorbifolium TaxID=99658 RepID=A0ABQ8HDI0_9ROSI|nr:hypothetical protein JRO89_XS12G0233800 [Xanthoceras sorbifolium]
MILSALLTSVGINLGLCFLFFTLYSILRKQPNNFIVYASRLVGKTKSEETHDFNLERLVPTPGWVKRAWEPSEEELLSTLGLDAVVFIRIFIFRSGVIEFGQYSSLFLVVNINLETFLQFWDFLRLWVHFCAAYVFTGVVCYLLHYEYSYISSKRVSYFYSSKPEPHQFTIAVRSIPVSSGSSVSEIVENFFKEYHHSTYLSHSVVRRTNKIQELINETDKLYRRLVFLKSSKDSQQTFKREGFLGLFGRKVNLLDHFEKKLEHLQDNVRMEQSSLAGKEIPAAFVSFKSRLGAAIALNIQQGTNPTEWVTEEAPKPQEVYWPFFSASFMKRWICNLVVVVAYIALTILFLIPVVIVQGLTHLEQLETWLPFLKDLLRLTFVSQVITGYLPSLILQLFLSFVPPIMILFTSIQGFISFSQIEKSACNKVWWFTVWNIFFANVLSGTALYQVSVFLEPKSIPKVLAQGVPGQASFFIAYVVTSGWTSLSSELLRLMPLLSSYCSWLCSKIIEEFEVPSFPYHSEIPRILFFGLLGVTYFFLAPLILPFLLVYYCMGYIIYRNQVTGMPF